MSNPCLKTMRGSASFLLACLALLLPRVAYAQNTPITNSFHPNTELVKAYDYWAGYSADFYDLSSLYPKSLYSYTNRNTLLLQPSDSHTFTDVHEDKICQPFADSTGGKFSISRGKGFLKRIIDGSLCDYGLVVVSTHGNPTNVFPREDGSWRSYLLIMDWGPFKKQEGEAFTEKTWKDFSEKFGLSEDEKTNYITFNKSNHMFVSTDFIMKYYEDKRFDNTVFFFDSCASLGDEKFKTFLVEHGATAMIGYINSVSRGTSLDYNKFFGSYITGENTSEERGTLRDLQDKFEKMPPLLISDRIINNHPYVYTKRERFSFNNRGKMIGHVKTTNDTPLADTLVVAYRYLDHGFQPCDVYRTDQNGRFEFNYLHWGLYVIDVLRGSKGDEGSYGRVSVDFGREEKDCGVIHVNTWMRSDAKEDESSETTGASEEPKQFDPPRPVESPTNSVTEALVSCLENELDQEYGQIPHGEQAFDSSYTGAPGETEHIAEVQTLLSGLVGSYIIDLDADGAPELLTMRVSTLPDEGFNSVYLEVYESLDGGAVERTAFVSYGTYTMASRFHDLRCAVFLGDPIPDGADDPKAARRPTINLFASASMNENFEVIRQFTYTGDDLMTVCERALVTGESWCSEYGKEPYRAEELVLTSMGYESEGWTLVCEASPNPSGDPETMWSDYAAADAEVRSNYADFWKGRGLPRNGARFSYELSDYGDTEKHGVRDAFEEGFLTWVGEVDCILARSEDRSIKIVRVND